MLWAYYGYDKWIKPRSRNNTGYLSVARAWWHGGMSGGCAVTCSSQGWMPCWFYTYGRCVPPLWAPLCARIQLPTVTARAEEGHNLLRGVRWAGETHWAVPTGNTRGFPLHPEGVLLEETSVMHPSVMLLSHLFTSSKNPEHQQVFFHWPNNHEVPHSHDPLPHSLFTWPNNPTLDTHQPHDNFVLHYRYISPQNMNMLKHPIMFWHACQKKKPMATKTTACQWQLLHAHTKLNYILLKRDIIMAFVSPHPHPFPPKIKGEISTHLKH